MKPESRPEGDQTLSVAPELFGGGPQKMDILSPPCLCQAPVLLDDDESWCHGCGKATPQAWSSQAVELIKNFIDREKAGHLICTMCGHMVNGLNYHLKTCPACKEDSLVHENVAVFRMREVLRDSWLGDIKKASVLMHQMGGKAMDFSVRSVRQGFEGLSIYLNNPFEDIRSLVPVRGAMGIDSLWTAINEMDESAEKYLSSLYRLVCRGLRADEAHEIDREMDNLRAAITQCVQHVSDILVKADVEINERRKEIVREIEASSNSTCSTYVPADDDPYPF